MDFPPGRGQPVVSGGLHAHTVKDRYLLGAVLTLVDLAAMFLAMFLALLLRESVPLPWPAGGTVLRWPYIVAIPLAWWLCLYLFEGYSEKWHGAGATEYNRVLMGSFTCIGALGVGLYLTSSTLSRGFYCWLAVVGISALLIGRYTVRQVINRAKAQGRFATSTIVVGGAGHVAALLQVLAREEWLGYRVDGLLIPDEDPDPSEGQIPILGAPEDVMRMLRRTGADAVMFTDGSFSQPSDFSELARQIEDLDAQIIFMPAVTDVSASRLMTRPVAGLPLMHVQRPAAARATAWSKRLFDIVGSLIALVVATPILLVAALLVRLTDPGPVLYRQQRIGIDGEPFTLYKLRSMKVNADRLKAKLADHSDGNGVMFKMARDPRITPVGRFLRRYSIDELPQLLNVLKGDMSLVGPRPALPDEVDQYDEHVKRRLAVRPGLSGLWQVSGRSDLSWGETVRLDLYYVDNWSMMQDLSILARTVSAVLRPQGAY